jgi:hypothetical protein
MTPQGRWMLVAAMLLLLAVIAASIVQVTIYQ